MSSLEAKRQAQPDQPIAPPAADPFALYRERRLAAVAIWDTVPLELFKMETWRCGSTACALGWLAERGYDGWYWHDREPWRGDDDGFWAASQYFALSDRNARRCFGGLFHYGRKTPSGVGKLLMSLPYAVQE